MTKERRLGRGLEALLGQIPSPSGAALPTQYRPAVEELYDGATEELYGNPPAMDGTGSPGTSGAYPLEEMTGPADPSAAHPLATPVSGSEVTNQSGAMRVDVRQIDSNPTQPRQDFDPAEMRSLAESIATHGLLQPVVLRRVEGRYQLIAGERRLRAAVQAGFSDVPANVVEADDRQVAEMAIVENLHRKDLNPLEKAASFECYLRQYGCTQEELATRLKLDRSTIANLIRLLELPEAVQEAIRQGKITQGHARALLPLGDEREQIDFSARIQREGLSVRQTEAMVQEAIDAADAEPLGIIGRDGKRSRAARPKNEHLAAVEQEFRAALGMKVKITHNARGRGKLVVHFRNHEEFERLRQHICGPAPANVQRQG